MINERFTNPFPGLRPFESTEDHLFFGRDGQSDELLRRLRRSRFLAVLGTSGSGKSSLVRAGMLPSLFGGLMTQAGSDWRVALFRPGHDPIGHLAASLASEEVLGSDGDDAALQKTIIEATLRRSALGLVEATRQARMPENENLLVVVDQFEEIFRFRRMSKREGPEDEAAAFIKLLLEAKRQTDVPVYIVITMRSDFLGDCAQFRDLPEAINDGQYLIPRMTRDQRREAITGPVAVGGGEISGRLVNRLLNDVGDDPDHLPILQHALMRTWEHWTHDRSNGEPIDLRHYDAVGTMSDALSRHADEAFAELPNERSRALAEKIFKSLTEKGPDNREIRRPTRVSEIAAIAESSPEEVIAVIEPFRQKGRSFLMPPAGVPLTADSLIDISHESLIRGWERLRKWVDAEARSANIYRRIADTAILHSEERAGLWHDPDLALALRWREENRPNTVWAEHYHPQFDLAMNFIDASKAANEAEIAERERARKKEVRRTRIFATIFGVLFLVAAAFGVFALQAKNTAYAARNEELEEKKRAEEQKKRADIARGEAVEQSIKAKNATDEALHSASVAESERQRAEEAAKVAEEQRAAAQAANVQAQQARAVAERRREEADHSRLEALVSAIRGRQQSLTDKSNINSLAERLIQLASPEEAAIWRNSYATSLAEMGREDLSKEQSAKVLDMFGDNLNALTNRGYMNLIEKDAFEALKDFERIRELDPKYALNYLNLAVSQANLRDYVAASNSIQKAIEWYRPGYFDGVFDSEVSDDIKNVSHRKVIYAEGNEFNAALYYEMAAIEAFQGSSDFEARVKAADQNAARTNATVEGYLTALNWGWLQLRKVEKDYGAWAIQAHLWQKAGYPDWARYYFLRFQCDHQNYKDARYAGLAKWVDQQVRLMPAAESQISCSKPPPINVDPRMRIFEVKELASIGKYEQALGLLEEEISRDPQNIDLLLLRARYRQAAGYWAGYYGHDDTRTKYYANAQQDLRTALKLAEVNPSYQAIVHLTIGFFGPSLGFDDDQVRSSFEKALDLGPANSSAMTELSARLAYSDPGKAKDLLRRSVALDPSADNYYRAAVLQNRMSDYKSSLASIKMAIALKNDDASYYEERERAEAGLGIGEVERKRHLASGYREIGDSLLKQGKNVAAFQTYRNAAEVLAQIAEQDKSGVAANELAVIRASFAKVTETNLEKVSGRILTLKGDGSTREATIDRGSADGVVAGAEGTVWSIYSKTDNQERKVQKIGLAKVIKVEPGSATVELTMDNDATGAKSVRADDMVEVGSRVPPLSNRSVLWRLARYHISFISEDGERVFVDYRKLYDEEDADLIKKILTQMTTEITHQALRISDAEIMKTVIKSGRFKDKTLKQVLDNPTREDVLAMMDELWQYPATYYGKDLKLFRTFAAWVLDEPK